VNCQDPAGRRYSSQLLLLVQRIILWFTSSKSMTLLVRRTLTPDTPLLWVLRDTLGMTGTKLECGIGACGARTAHVEGVATRVYIRCMNRSARLLPKP